MNPAYAVVTLAVKSVRMNKCGRTLVEIPSNSSDIGESES